MKTPYLRRKVPYTNSILFPIRNRLQDSGVIARFLIHPVARSYLSLAFAGGLVLSTLIIAFEVYVATTGSPNLDFVE